MCLVCLPTSAPVSLGSLNPESSQASPKDQWSGLLRPLIKRAALQPHPQHCHLSNLKEHHLGHSISAIPGI